MINYYILVVCSVPPSLLAVAVQDNNSRPYVEGDVVVFQCLSGMCHTDVMIATCTVDGSWWPDPQQLNCSCATEDSTIMSAQGMQYCSTK